MTFMHFLNHLSFLFSSPTTSSVTSPLQAHCLLHLSSFFLCQKAPKKAKKRTAEGANSNVFSMFEQAQIQEFKEVKAAQLIFILLILHLAEMDCGNGV